MTLKELKDKTKVQKETLVSLRDHIDTTDEQFEKIRACLSFVVGFENDLNDLSND